MYFRLHPIHGIGNLEHEKYNPFLLKRIAEMDMSNSNYNEDCYVTLKYFDSGVIVELYD